MTQDNHEIRKLRADDLAGLLALYQDIDLLDPASAREQLEHTWRRILASDFLCHLGVFVEGTLAATCQS